MYSKSILNRYISERLKQKDWTMLQLANELGISPSNLTRALTQDQFNLTLPQFSQLVQLLGLTPDQTYHILTGKKAKEASSQLVVSYAKKLVAEVTKESTK
jgi:transcriptional regulator with XRE-family HTH domain